MPRARPRAARSALSLTARFAPSGAGDAPHDAQGPTDPEADHPDDREPDAPEEPAAPPPAPTPRKPRGGIIVEDDSGEPEPPKAKESPAPTKGKKK